MQKRKHNKYAEQAAPQATLDFHGLGILAEHEIYETVNHFLDVSHDKGYHFVAVIVGKGLHSAQGPVIGPLLRSYIPTLPFVKECLDAPYTRGGAGALEIKFTQ